MMNANFCLVLLLAAFVAKEVNCSFNELKPDIKPEVQLSCDLNASNFEDRKKEKNLFVLFVKDYQFGEINQFFSQVKDLYDMDATSTIAFAKVDCTACGTFCHNQNISKLLELRYFAKDSFDSLQMCNFINERIEESLARHAAEEAAKVKLQDGKSFVKFYAPECPACKGMENDWSELEKTYENNPNIKIFSIDCKKARMTCKKFKIKNFPTLISFEDGKADKMYSDEKTLDKFKSYLEKRWDLSVPQATTPKPDSYVITLTPQNLNQTIENGTWLVKFNLKGCHHCVILDPLWKEAAENLSNVEGLHLAEIECMFDYSFCLQFNSHAFPTINIYKNGVEKQHDYSEVFTTQGFIDCAVAHHTGGEHLEKWMEEMKQHKKERRALRAAEKAAEEAAKAAGNSTVTVPASNH